MYYKLPIKDRMDLMKSYKKANPKMSYSDMVNDYNDSYQKFGDGGKKEIPTKNEKKLEDNDSWLENVGEIVDPTGVSSWDDVYRAYKNTGFSKETALEAFGAIPLIGKIGKSGKIITGGFNLLQNTVKVAQHLPPKTKEKVINKTYDVYQNYIKHGGKELDDVLGYGTKKIVENIPYLNPEKWKSSSKAINTANAAFKIGKTSDAIQAVLGAKDNSGFTWDLRHGEVPKYGGRNIFPQSDADYKYGGIQRFDDGGKKSVPTADNTNVARSYFPNPDNTNMDPRRIPQSGMVVDKRTNQAYYFGDDGDTGTFPVLTAKNPEANKNTYSLSQLAKNSNLRSTPKGYYMVEKESKYKSKDDMQHYKGLMRSLNPIEAYGESKPSASDLALHLTFTDPGNPKVFKNREHLYNEVPQKRYASYGCVNCQEPSYRAFNKAIPESDTLMMLDSKDPKDLRLLKQAQSRIKTKIKD